MSKLTFRSAVSRWRAWRDAVPAAEQRTANEPFDDAAHARAEEAERVILDHTPADAAEAEILFELLIACLEDGGRSDGRDVQAMKRLRPFIAGAVTVGRRSAA